MRIAAAIAAAIPVFGVVFPEVLAIFVGKRGDTPQKLYPIIWMTLIDLLSLKNLVMVLNYLKMEMNCFCAVIVSPAGA